MAVDELPDVMFEAMVDMMAREAAAIRAAGSARR
jgi:hypothetical protein